MTIECTDLEAEVLLYALDSLSTGLILDRVKAPSMVDGIDLAIDIATEVAERINEQLRPDAALIRAERERLQANAGSMIAVFTDLQNPL